ncbi:MAG TPA: hypothetical protein VGN17_04955 [Bryobacteraceae bacterium]|jgi:hypothetical protein
MKPLAHAIIFTALMNAANLLPRPAGVDFTMRLLQPGAFSIFAASTAAALNDRKALVLLIVGGIILLGTPSNAESFARFLIPEGLGIITGSLARRLVTEETANGTTTPKGGA